MPNPSHAGSVVRMFSSATALANPWKGSKRSPLRLVFSNRGRILAIKGIGGFHLAVDATDEKAVERLRERKRRVEKPLALMSPSLEKIAQYAYVSAMEAQVLQSPERPIVLLRKRNPSAISSQVAARNPCFGVMLPYTPLHYLILQQGFLALVLTSGNISEEPIAIDNEEAFGRLSGVADYFLVHNRDIHLRNDDSIVRVVGRKMRMIRRSRGYVPSPSTGPSDRPWPAGLFSPTPSVWERARMPFSASMWEIWKTWRPFGPSKEQSITSRGSLKSILR